MDDGVFGSEPLGQDLGCGLGLGRFTAGKNIGRHVSVLGPGMDRKMGLGQHGNSRDALGTEGVNINVQQRCIRRANGIEHRGLHALGIVNRVAAPPQFDDDMPAQVLHQNPRLLRDS